MKISVLIPAHNEGKSIKTCVQSALNQTRKPDQIVVVNDGSTDKTGEILKTFGRKIKVVTIPQATGNKSYAQEHGMRHIKGEIVVMTDGDTKFDKNFIAEIEKDFKDPNVAAVGGFARSIKYNWLTAYRAFEYVIGQDIHKYAQNILNYVFVIPGAAAAIRVDIFNKYVGFDHDTVTEDLDFTYKLHRQNLKVKFNKKAIVYTQDPTTIKMYVNQLRRWYGGGFQNLSKHLYDDLLEDPRRAFELSLMYVDGFAFSILIFLIPLLNLGVAVRYYSIFFMFLFVQALYAALREKRFDILSVPITYTFLMFINSAVFIEQFVKEIILRKKNLVWHNLDVERIEI